MPTIYIDTITRAIAGGIDINIVDSSKRIQFVWDDPALVWAAEAGQVDIVKLLIAGGATVNTTNAEGNTALSLALATRNIDVVSVLSLAYHQQNIPQPSLTLPADMAAQVTDYLAEHCARQAMIQALLQTLPFKAADEDERPSPTMVLDLILRLKLNNGLALISAMLNQQYDPEKEIWQTQKKVLPNELKYDRILQDVVSDFCNNPEAYLPTLSRQNLPSLPQIMPNDLPEQLSRLGDALLTRPLTDTHNMPPAIYKTLFWEPLQQEKQKAQLEADALIRGLYPIESKPKYGL